MTKHKRRHEGRDEVPKGPFPVDEAIDEPAWTEDARLGYGEESSWVEGVNLPAADEQIDDDLIP